MDRYKPIREAFSKSYAVGKRKNIFTKVNISLEADKVLQDYFSKNLNDIESWFNVISPSESSLDDLKDDLQTLYMKSWERT